MKYIREKGVHFVLFLDDGWGINATYDLALEDAGLVKSVAQNAGFVLNLESSVFKPTQGFEWLDIVWDMHNNCVRNSEKGYQIHRIFCINVFKNIHFCLREKLLGCLGKLYQ